MKFPYPVGFDVPLFLAPMAGVSEAPFRQICRRFGADVVVSEFISSVGVSLQIERASDGAEHCRIDVAALPVDTIWF